MDTVLLQVSSGSETYQLITYCPWPLSGQQGAISSVALTAMFAQPCVNRLLVTPLRGDKIHMSPAIYGLLLACFLI